MTSNTIQDVMRRRGGLSQLKAIQLSLVPGMSLPADIAFDFNRLVGELREFLFPNPDQFVVPAGAFRQGGSGSRYCDPQIFRSKLQQAISYLETTGDADANIVRAGTLFNSIRDEELKRRCSDLLSAPGAFDRAINQATQVLEDRIRRKAGDGGKDLTGVELVNRMIKSVPTSSTITVSVDPAEQEGFANMCRGVMQAFRNPTHHQITDRFSREDALKVCAFVDLLLTTLDTALS